MPIRLIDEDAEEFVPLPVYGHAIAETRSAAYHAPETAYVMYFTFTRTFKQVVIHATCTIDSTREVADARLLNIIKRHPGAPEIRKITPNDKIIWNRPTYLTLILDIPDYKWPYDLRTGKFPIDFLEEKDGKHYNENFSFYDAVEGTVDGLPSIMLTNYLKGDANGSDLQDENDKREYCMLFNFLVPTDGEHEPWSWDPDSENQGPGGG